MCYVLYLDASDPRSARVARFAPISPNTIVFVVHGLTFMNVSALDNRIATSFLKSPRRKFSEGSCGRTSDVLKRRPLESKHVLYMAYIHRSSQPPRFQHLAVALATSLSWEISCMSLRPNLVLLLGPQRESA